MNLDNLMITFIDFFKQRGYKCLIKNNIINYNKTNSDLLFINSGIAGILDKFNNEKIDKLITVQTCLRIDGKHNDFDNIGNSKSHFSAFKMLGTFSNNNTNILDMIKDIYDFIINIIPFKNIYVTVHSEDINTKNIWLKIDPKIEINYDNNNIWSMGNSGPQGYCTEIYYYDSSDKSDAIELWNIVMINHIIKNGKIIKTENIYLDTGGGLERLYSVFDDKHDVYLIDEVFNTINYLLKFYSFENSKIILDSIRSISLMLDNNVIISNNKHGYVLKKLFRKLIYTLITNSEFNESNIIYIFSKYIKKIREFLYILKKETIAIRKCDSLLLNYINHKKQNIEIDDIVKLHDTYGIHFTHTLNFLKSNNLNVNYKIEDIKNRIYKNQTTIKNKFNIIKVNNIKQTEFIYDLYELKIVGNIIVYNNDLSFTLEAIDINKDFCLILDKTIFYPEGGGQIYDKGTISLNNKTIATVNKVLKNEEYIVHYCTSNTYITLSDLKSSTLKIDIFRRKHLANSHSIHHILIHTIENLLCENIYQQSSNINIDKTSLSFYSIRKLSSIVNESQLTKHLQDKINSISKINIHLIDTNTAITNNYKSIMTGYERNSRAIEIYNNKNELISKELCCGTHMIDKNIKVLIEKIIEQNSYITKIIFKVFN